MARPWSLLGAILLCVLVVGMSVPIVRAADSAGDIQDDIAKVQKKLDQAAKKKAALETNLGQINQALSATLSAINRTQAAINDTQDTIERKRLEIQLLEQQIELKTEILTDLFQNMYFTGQPSEVEVAFGGSDLSFATSATDNYASFQERMKALLDDIHGLRSRTEGEKTTLEDIKKEKQDLLDEKVDQKQELASDQAETKQDIQTQAEVIKRLNKELAELQKDLSVLTGKSYNAKDIREAVEYASGKTGVPEGVLYGFLKMETNLGVNTGQCTYTQVKKDAMDRYYSKDKKKYKNSIALLERRYGIFLDLVDELGYSKDKKVSCTPGSYVGQGGAMGVAQFMSDVWRGYEARITARTGHKNPDPWGLTDGVMAMALKIASAGGTSSKESAIKQASINYLGAFNSNYYNGIVYWSKNYKSLFK